MSLFKKRTEEEKQVKREQRSEEARQGVIKERLERLESKVFPKMSSPKFKEIIRNLDEDLSLFWGSFPFEIESVLKIEHLLTESETLLGFIDGLDDTHRMQMLVMTSDRIVLITDGKKNMISTSYSELKSTSFKSIKGYIPGRADGELTFYTANKSHKFTSQWVKSIEKAHQVINKAKETFLANPANLEKANPVNTPQVPEQDERSITEQLNELKQLLYSRTITQEQYDTMKSKITGKQHL